MNVAVPPASVVLPDTVPTSSPPSSSITVTVTSAANDVGYAVVSPVPLTVCDSVTVSLTVSVSSLAVAVTVCAMFHVVAVNNSVSGATPTASVSPVTLTATVTGPPGSAVNRTGYAFALSAWFASSYSVSVVWVPPVFGSVSTPNPAVSSSTVVTCVLVCVASAVYASSGAPAGSRWIA